MITYKNLAEINQPVYRNICLQLEFDEFDDLTDHPDTRSYAHSLANIHFHVIDYVFLQESWHTTRFGDGTFPVWYGSGDVITSFYETVYHWKRIFIESPVGFSQTEKNIVAYRNLFEVNCHAALLDIRSDVKKDLKLIDKNPANYSYTQQIGSKVFTLGQPGLITKSARHAGDCMAIFNKKVLSSPRHEGDYFYEYDVKSQSTTVKKKNSQEVMLIMSG